MVEGYSYFSLTIPDPLKVDVTKICEGEEPENIHKAYKRLRTLALTWTSTVEHSGSGEKPRRK